MFWWSSNTKVGLPRLKKYEFYIQAILGFFHGVNPWFFSKIIWDFMPVCFLEK